MRMNPRPFLFGLLMTPLLLGALAGCDQSNAGSTAEQQEQRITNQAQKQLLRNQPVPVFDYSMERHIAIEIYKARQRRVATFSVVQSPFTGKVLWSCPSIGFPIPYATQLTNPLQPVWAEGQHEYAGVAVAQPEPNGLYSPAQADATWVPCVDDQGHITPVYEEKHVTVFFRPMEEKDGRLVPVVGSKASFSITVGEQAEKQPEK